MLPPPSSTPSPSAAPVLIAGGGIGGMALALTLHQIGVPCIVFEAVPALQPLGVGINLQPNAVRELYDLGFTDAVLDTIGIQAREWALVGRNGRDVYAEPRGLLAGYRWPQYSVHRGELQMMLLRAVLQRLGPDAVRLGQKTGYDYALFMHAEDQVASTGRVVLGVLGAAGCLVGFCAPNIGGATQLDYASLVDLKTGEVVWFNVVQASSQIPGIKFGELRTPQGAAQMVDRLLGRMKPGQAVRRQQSGRR